MLFRYAFGEMCLKYSYKWQPISPRSVQTSAALLATLATTRAGEMFLKHQISDSSFLPFAKGLAEGEIKLLE